MHFMRMFLGDNLNVFIQDSRDFKFAFELEVIVECIAHFSLYLDVLSARFLNAR